MLPHTPIPECEGIYGVGKSGSPIQTTRLDYLEDKGNLVWTPGKVADLRPRRIEGFKHIAIESGGLQICRPLLGFTKEQLKATCKSTDTGWVEDETNQNVSLTPRNAIRSLLQSNRLPQALRSRSIHHVLQLAKVKADGITDQAENFLQECSIRTLDLRTGTLYLSTPTSSWVRMLGFRFPSNYLHFYESKLIALREIIQLVSPRPALTVSRLHKFESVLEKSAPLSPLRPFTSCGLLFEELYEQDAPLEPTPVDRYQRVWKITRAPPSASEIDTKMTWQPSDVDANDPGYEVDGWKFWDNRYWIWIRNTTARQISVRFFHQEDMRPFLTTLSSKDYKRAQNLFKKLAPGKSRWSLPAICSNRVLALPTLGIAVQGAEQEAKWLTRFKNIDLTVLKRGSNRRSIGDLEHAGELQKSKRVSHTHRTHP
jgi:tRNA(Ile)-lysidine synthase